MESTNLYKGFSRLSDFPLDDRSIFETPADVEQYLQNENTAYFGQLVRTKNPVKLFFLVKENHSWKVLEVPLNAAEIRKLSSDAQNAIDKVEVINEKLNTGFLTINNTILDLSNKITSIENNILGINTNITDIFNRLDANDLIIKETVDLVDDIYSSLNNIKSNKINNAIENNSIFAVGRKDISENVLSIYNDGIINAEGYSSNISSIAEYFEWTDYPSTTYIGYERCGLFIKILDDGKIDVCNESENPDGVVTIYAGYAGNAYEDYWHKKYERNDFGFVIYENGHPKISDEFDQNMEYIPRSQRPDEWGCVALSGTVCVRDDGTCNPGDNCWTGSNGVATRVNNSSGFKVIKRISDNVIKILLK